MDRMGLKVVLAVTEAGMCHLLLFAVDMFLVYRVEKQQYLSLMLPYKITTQKSFEIQKYNQK